MESSFFPFYHLELPTGTKSYRQLIAEVPCGLLITEAMGVLDGSLLNGDISGSILNGYVIEHGEIIGRIKNARFRCNVFKHFRDHLLDFSGESNLVSTFASQGAYATLPYVLLDEVAVDIK